MLACECVLWGLRCVVLESSVAAEFSLSLHSFLSFFLSCFLRWYNFTSRDSSTHYEIKLAMLEDTNKASTTQSKSEKWHSHANFVGLEHHCTTQWYEYDRKWMCEWWILKVWRRRRGFYTNIAYYCCLKKKYFLILLMHFHFYEFSFCKKIKEIKRKERLSLESFLLLAIVLCLNFVKIYLWNVSLLCSTISWET
jgi:hypothetical protein